MCVCALCLCFVSMFVSVFVCVPVVALGPDRHPLPVEAAVRIAGEGATCSHAHHVDVIPEWLISLLLIYTSYDSTINPSRVSRVRCWSDYLIPI